MATEMTLDATEQSTYALEIQFLDEEGAGVTPTAATWTLTDPKGNVVNSREDVTIVSPAETEDVVLSGEDLALEGYSTRTRHFTVEATYNSSLGSGLPLKAVITFEIEDLVAVP